MYLAAEVGGLMSSKIFDFRRNLYSFIESFHYKRVSGEVYLLFSRVWLFLVSLSHHYDWMTLVCGKMTISSWEHDINHKSRENIVFFSCWTRGNWPIKTNLCWQVLTNNHIKSGICHWTLTGSRLLQCNLSL